MSQSRDLVSVVVLAYGDEPLLVPCLRAIRHSREVTLEIVLVDNGVPRERIREALGLYDRLVEPGRNTGFAGGCNLGVSHASGDVLVFVNSDALVSADAVRLLSVEALTPSVGIATASVRLADRPEIMNSAGNPIHFTGLSWAGGFGEPAANYATSSTVASASGCAMAMRRAVWDHLGGFYDDMFAYLEDTDLSLRCWQAGWQVRYVSDAVVTHAYEFSRNPLKLYYLERNRLLMVSTVYSAKTLTLLAPPLLALEAAMVAVALRQGWMHQKLRGWWWMALHLSRVAKRRHQVQASRRKDDRVLAHLLTSQFTPGPGTGIPTQPLMSHLADRYWRLVRRFIR